jgi:dTDP-4-amino-4,6-dideoxygalactose transaminase
LESREVIQARRKHVWCYYYEHLQDWAVNLGVQLPFVPEDCQHPYHLFYVIMNSPEERAALISHLQARKVNAIFHYQPLNRSRMGQRLGNQGTDQPVAEAMSNRLLRLPFYNAMTADELSQVVAAVKSFGP